MEIFTAIRDNFVQQFHKPDKSSLCSRLISCLNNLEVVLFELQSENPDTLGSKSVAVAQANNLLNRIKSLTDEQLEKQKIDLTNELNDCIASIFLYTSIETEKKLVGLISNVNSNVSTMTSLEATSLSTDNKVDSLITSATSIKSDLKSLKVQMEEFNHAVTNQTISSVESLFNFDPPAIDIYDEKSVLSKGLFGNVHRMINNADNNLYAVKISLKTDESRKRLQLETSFLQQLYHPNIVRYFTSFFFDERKQFRMAMELITGSSIANAIIDANVSTDTIIVWFEELASALCYMHYEKHIQHRDIKPENILLTGDKHIKIIDFSSASLLTEDSHTNMIGSEIYASYEKANGLPYDGRDDVWATGLVMVELFTRKRLEESLYLYTDSSVNSRRLQLISSCKSVNVPCGQLLDKMLIPREVNRIHSVEVVQSLKTLNKFNIPHSAYNDYDDSCFRVELSSIEIKIVGTENNGTATMYELEIICGHHQWMLFKSFGDFCKLFKQLKKYYPKLTFPDLPVQLHLQSLSNYSYIELVRVELEKFINSLVVMDSIWNHNCVASFLNNDINTMILLWNNQQLHRMQDILNEVNDVEKKQVSDLQNRLSKMRMLFLQQAAGVTDEKSCSVAVNDINELHKLFEENFEVDGTKVKVYNRISVVYALNEHISGVVENYWASVLISKVDLIIDGLIPTRKSLKIRRLALNDVRDVVAGLGIQLFTVGSIVNRIFLPDGDADTTAFVLNKDADTWLSEVKQKLQVHKAKYLTREGKSFEKMINAKVRDVSIDISVNQLHTLYAQLFIRSIDSFIGQNHLFKKSILLVKGWCLNDSYDKLSGGKLGKISSWAVVIMLSWVFHSEGAAIKHPIQALGGFLRIFSNFNWNLYALSVEGPVSRTDLTPVEGISYNAYFPVSLIKQLRDRCTDVLNSLNQTFSFDDSNVASTMAVTTQLILDSAFPLSDNIYQRGMMNVMDPVNPVNNVTKTINYAQFDSVKLSLQEGYKRYQNFCVAFSKVDNKSSKSVVAGALDILFKYTNEKRLLLNDSSKQVEFDSESSRKDLEFALHYGEFIIGGVIHPEILVHLINQIKSEVYFQTDEELENVTVIENHLKVISGREDLPHRINAKYGSLIKFMDSHRVDLSFNSTLSNSYQSLKSARNLVSTISERKALNPLLPNSKILMPNSSPIGASTTTPIIPSTSHSSSVSTPDRTSSKNNSACNTPSSITRTVSSNANNTPNRKTPPSTPFKNFPRPKVAPVVFF